MASAAIRYPIEVGRNKTANGGDEWFLLCAGERVPMARGVGIFTEPGEKPEEMLARLLRRATEFTPPERVGTDPLLRTQGVGPGPGRDHME